MTIEAPDYVAATVLNHGKYKLFGSGAQVIAASASYTTGNILITKPGYWIFANAQMAANAANPFVQVTVTWKDVTSGLILDLQEWVIPAGTTAAIRTNGRGPVTGDEVSIKFTNLDTVQAVTVNMLLFETTHAIARHDWRADMVAGWTSISVNTFAAPGSPFSGSLFQGAPSIPGATTNFYQLGLYAGAVSFQESDPGTTPLTINILPTQSLDTATVAAAVYTFTGAAAGVHGSLVLPRQPCQVKIVNANAGAIVCTLNIGILEYAS